MCGIFGTVNIYGKEEEKKLCLSRLAHRGPDGKGIWKDDIVFLGHRRLAILDLSDQGKQPMSYDNGRYIITYNGEIYNFMELREELEQVGYKFNSNSDTEVILATYSEWGEKCQDLFNGMWAFAIYDRITKTMFWSRDRYGVKPFFYTKTSGGIAFASEMKALTPVMSEYHVNEKLIRSMNQLYETTEECLIKEIKRLPAGHCAYINCDTNAIILKEWYSPLSHLNDLDTKAYEEQVEEFRELFLDACRIRMRSDVPIGTALSGGLDSSSTISAMAYIGNREHVQNRINDDWQHAFIASMPGTSIDETKYARDVAQYLNIKDTVVEIDPVKYWKNIEKYLYYFEEIYSTSPVPMMALYEAERNSGVTVTIDGHGADEMYGGYTFNMIHAFRDAQLNLKQISQVARAYTDCYPDEGNLSLLTKNKSAIYFKYVLQSVKKAIPHGDGIARIYTTPEWKRLDYLNKVLYRSTFLTILPTLLRNYDRYSMANGVEIRMPFMDYRLVEKAFTLGWNSKIRNGFTKSIIRDAMAPFMPKHIAYRKSKIGFNTPIGEWMHGGLREWFLEEAHSKAFQECPYIDANAVRQKICDVIGKKETKFDVASNCWSLMVPYLWEQYFYKKQ